MDEMNIKVVKNIRYGGHPRQLLDVYLPVHAKQECQSAPVVICVHGGAWSMSNKSQLTEIGYFLAKRGFTAVLPSYRLSDIINHDTGVLVVHHCIVSLALIGILFYRYKINASNNTGSFAFSALVSSIVSSINLVAHRMRPVSGKYNTNPKRSNLCSKQYRSPDHALDVATSLKWVTTVGYIMFKTMDSRKISILGHSAGAHLACLVANNPFYTRMVGVDHSSIASVISISGVYCQRRLLRFIFGRAIHNMAFDSLKFDLTSHSVKKNSGGYIKAKPFPITECSAVSPPHLLIAAQWDLSLVEQAMAYAAALRYHRVSVKLYCDRKLNTTHFSIWKNWGTTNSQVGDTVVNFLRNVGIRKI